MIMHNVGRGMLTNHVPWRPMSYVRYTCIRIQENKKKIPAMVQSLAKLVNNDRLKINYTEYELATEFDEALEHALEESKCTKVLLKVNDLGSTYD